MNKEIQVLHKSLANAVINLAFISQLKHNYTMNAMYSVTENKRKIQF